MSAIPWTPIVFHGTLKHSGTGVTYERTEISFINANNHEICLITGLNLGDSEDGIYGVVYNGLVYIYNNTEKALVLDNYNMTLRGIGPFIPGINSKQVNTHSYAIASQELVEAFGLSVSSVDPMTFDGNFGEKIPIPVRWRGLEDTFNIMIDDE